MSARLCSADGCGRPVKALGLCRRHYADLRRSRPAAGRRLCSVEGCGRLHHALGYCQMHWGRQRVGVPLEGPPPRSAACSVEGCGRLHKARGLCDLHWRRARRGRPLDWTPFGPLTERFWRKVDKSAGPEGCWPWTGSRHGFGYGFVSAGGKRRGAHRVSWELANGPIPDGLSVCHRCDNPPCVNPAHLFLGTVGDNTRDMMAKGRAIHQRWLSSSDTMRALSMALYRAVEYAELSMPMLLGQSAPTGADYIALGRSVDDLRYALRELSDDGLAARLEGVARDLGLLEPEPPEPELRLVEGGKQEGVS